MADVRFSTGLDTKGYERGINKMNTKTQKFSQSLGAMKGLIVGAFSIGAIKAFAGSIVRLSSDIFHNAQQTKTSIEGYQSLMRTFELANGSAGQLNKMLTKLSSAQARALGGDETAARGFRNLGLAVGDLKGLNVEQLLVRIAQAQRENGQTTEWAYGMYDIFGDRLTRIANEVLPQLADGINEVSGTITTETAAALAEAEDMWTVFTRNVQSMVANAYTDAAHGARRLWGGLFSMMRGGTFWGGVTEQDEARANELETFRRKLTGGTGPPPPPPPPPAPAGRTPLAKTPVDRLARIGAKVGGQVDPQIAILQRQLTVADQTLAATREIARNTEQAGGIAA